MPYPIVNPLGSIHYTSKISVPSLYWCSGYELPVFPSLDDIYCIDNEINCMFLVCLKFYIWYHDFISLKYFTLLRYFILLKHFSLLKFSDFTPLKYFSVLKYFFKMKYLYSVKYLMVLTYLHISFCTLTVHLNWIRLVLLLNQCQLRFYCLSCVCLMSESMANDLTRNTQN